jgi:hypothetical protein
MSTLTVDSLHLPKHIIFIAPSASQRVDDASVLPTETRDVRLRHNESWSSLVLKCDATTQTESIMCPLSPTRGVRRMKYTPIIPQAKSANRRTM